MKTTLGKGGWYSKFLLIIVLIGILAVVFWLGTFYKPAPKIVKSNDINVYSTDGNIMSLIRTGMWGEGKIYITDYDFLNNTVVNEYTAGTDHNLSGEVTSPIFDRDTGDIFYKSASRRSEMDDKCYEYQKNGMCVTERIYKDNVFVDKGDVLIYNPSSDKVFTWTYDPENKQIYLVEREDNKNNYYSIDVKTQKKFLIQTIDQDKSMFSDYTLYVDSKNDQLVHIYNEENLNYIEIKYINVNNGEVRSTTINEGMRFDSVTLSPDFEKLAILPSVAPDGFLDKFLLYDIESKEKKYVPLDIGFSLGNMIPVWSGDSKGIFTDYKENVKDRYLNRPISQLNYFDFESGAMKNLISSSDSSFHILSSSDSGRYLTLRIFDLSNPADEGTLYYLDNKDGSLTKMKDILAN